eukprot:TRINITY_DN80354_c0_g1_i1.p1 TRINITY_DN80354_c0_g1~~TRINITY_DN80354_c0_g1_i1.p1  ORF type:complete len:915 (-),score=296.95 TRINITY_DN80354_c0_g1_i1:170-2914(-)
MVAVVDEDIVIMDGSMGRQLCLDGMPQDDLFRQIWSARALVDESFHRMVIDAHKSYIEAGATLLITNAYGVQPTFYRRAYKDDWEAKMLRDAELASKLAVQARQAAGVAGVRIYGCLPPLSESHRPDAFAELLAKEGRDFVVRNYRNLAKASLKGGAEALILENMVSWEEAELALEAAKDLGVSLIVSMEGALRDMEREPHPEKAPEVAQRVIEAKKAGAPIEALGFSCTEPETILECLMALDKTQGLNEALRAAGIKLSAHANLNDRKEAHKKGFDVREDKSKAIKARADLVYGGFDGYVKFCREFVKYGASYIGGCCGCGPQGIVSMKNICKANFNGAGSAAVNGQQTADTAMAAALAPTGVLRVGLNVANTLLVKGCSSAREAEGVAPAMGAELAKRLGVDVRYIPYKGPGELAEAIDADAYDVAFLAADAKRAAKIFFSPAYVEVRASYLVPAGSPILKISDVDKPGVRIACFGGTAYDNWLSQNIKHAKVIRTTSRADAADLLVKGEADALAALKEHLLQEISKVPGGTILEGSFMAAQHAIGTRHGHGAAVENFMKKFVEDAATSGLLQGILDRFGCTGKVDIPLAVPTAEHPAKRQRTAQGMKICILGCGAMGSVYAALLAEGGNEVYAVDVWADHVKAINANGLRVQGPRGDKTVKIKATTNVDDVGLCDLVVIATKASGVKDAAEKAAKLLKEDGVVLTIQNGLGAGERIAQHIDEKKVMLGIASNFGASLKGPGHAEHKSMKLICLGELVAGPKSQRLERVVAAWKTSGFDVQGFEDIHQQVWEKFICNCTYSGSCTLTGMTVGDVLDNPAAWNVALTCAREADAVARKMGIKLSFEDVEAHVRKFGESVRGAKPSMLQDHEAKRRSEIDAINGAVPVQAAKVGLSAPANQIVADAIRAKESLF